MFQVGIGTKWTKIGMIWLKQIVEFLDIFAKFIWFSDVSLIDYGAV